MDNTNDTSILRATFIHCPGVGPVTESRLWSAGICDWPAMLREPDRAPVGPALRDALCEMAAESLDHLADRDFAWFAQRLPAREHWRAVPDFRSSIAFVDIETTGGMEPWDLTVVGMHDGSTLHQYVRNENLADFPEVMADRSLIVTFFGTGFDLPFLRHAYRMEFPQLHVDLCFLLKRLGYRGGLKRVEEAFGLRRPDETHGMSGLDAVRLWWDWINNDNAESRRLLLAYNAEDVVNMATLLDAALPMMQKAIGMPGVPE